MRRALRHWNLSPLMAIAVALIFLSMWVDVRAGVTPAMRLPADFAVGIALLLVVAQGVRGPRIEYASLHPRIGPWLLVLLVASLVTSVLFLIRWAATF